MCNIIESACFASKTAKILERPAHKQTTRPTVDGPQVSQPAQKARDAPLSFSCGKRPGDSAPAPLRIASGPQLAHFATQGLDFGRDARFGRLASLEKNNQLGKRANAYELLQRKSN